ncbi:uncharacterized protein LOC131690298 [Topomyia yanbarensis]|uniref:uncharacterized protein LOC131690298 n=1 Tax=Topomyia yanbarensis TaxID=2498891 RepID=UPI00273AC6F6|nr:uncharacterized protein LOC131690298 [Topomyia yanbarensis]
MHKIYHAVAFGQKIISSDQPKATLPATQPSGKNQTDDSAGNPTFGYSQIMIVIDWLKILTVSWLKMASSHTRMDSTVNNSDGNVSQPSTAMNEIFFVTNVYLFLLSNNSLVQRQQTEDSESLPEPTQILLIDRVNCA